MYVALREAESQTQVKIIAMQVECGNHIHLAIKASPNYSISSFVNRLKALSTKALWEIEADHLRQFYWGPKRMLWHGAYYCSTIGNVSEGKVLEYVRNQNGPPEKAIHRRR